MSLVSLESLVSLLFLLSLERFAEEREVLREGDELRPVFRGARDPVVHTLEVLITAFLARELNGGNAHREALR